MAIDYSKRPKGMSKREYFASVTGKPKTEYGKDGSSDSGLSGIVKSFLGATPGFNEPTQKFEEFYGEKMQSEDRAQSEALFKPYFEKQISDSLEDLNSWAELDSINYNRTLRQGRAKMAQIGAAVGSERTNWESETQKRNEMNKQEKVRTTERSVGSDAIKGAGYESAYGSRVGTITDSMNAAIEDQVLRYRDNAMDQYKSQANATYKSPASSNYLGKSL